MPNSLYIAVTAFASGSTLCFGLCFLFLYIPESLFLKPYRAARKMMALAYLCLSLLYVLEVIFNYSGGNIVFARAVKLAAGSFQALLFTYTFIGLINTDFAMRKSLIGEVIPIGVFILAISISGLWGADSLAFTVSYFLFIGYYLSMLIRYLLLFLREYKACWQRADNYYADDEALRIRWIYYSFWAIFSIGAFLVPLLLLRNNFYNTVFTLSFIVFYSYFGIGFIQYAFRYKSIAPLAIASEVRKPMNTGNNEQSAQNQSIKQALDVWVSKNSFLQPGLTIEMLALELSTNRTYLSNYINQVKQQTFRSWINSLKIDKAKELLLEHPDMLIVEVAILAGYSDSSNFNKQFVKQSGTSAQIWRKQHLVSELQM